MLASKTSNLSDLWQDVAAILRKGHKHKTENVCPQGGDSEKDGLDIRISPQRQISGSRQQE